MDNSNLAAGDPFVYAAQRRQADLEHIGEVVSRTHNDLLRAIREEQARLGRRDRFRAGQVRPRVPRRGVLPGLAEDHGDGGRGAGRSREAVRVVHAVEVEDFNSSYGLYSGEVRVASFTDGRAGYREWGMRTGRLSPVSRTGTTISTDELI